MQFTLNRIVLVVQHSDSTAQWNAYHSKCIYHLTRKVFKFKQGSVAHSKVHNLKRERLEECNIVIPRELVINAKLNTVPHIDRIRICTFNKILK